MKLPIVGFCPVHFPLEECSDDCLPVRQRFVHTAHLLSSYWRDRKRGVRPWPVYRRLITPERKTS